MVRVITTWNAAAAYLQEARGAAEGAWDAIWARRMITPYWAQLTRQAPEDMAQLMPPPVKDLGALERQLFRLRALDTELLSKRFEAICAQFPCAEGEAVLVALYPLDNADVFSRMRLNGVVGGGLFGSILLQINPLAGDFLPWVLYAFAHAWHQTVWAGAWDGRHGDAGVGGTLREIMVIDGMANVFAEEATGRVAPWCVADDLNIVARRLRPMLTAKDRDTIDRAMYGDAVSGIPWRAGYAVGREWVRRYMDARGIARVADIAGVKPVEIAAG